MPSTKFLRKYSDLLLTRNAMTLAAVVLIYKKMFLRLRPTIINFADEMAELDLIGQPALRTAQGNELIRALISEVDKAGGLVSALLTGVIYEEIANAGGDFGEQMALLLPDETWLASNLVYATPGQVAALHGFIAESGPLSSYLGAGYGRRMADKVISSLLAGLVGGKSPRATAALISQKLGIALNDALNITRTTTLWAYRAAAHTNYLLNSHVLKGWIWFAQLDERTCMSCVNLHGSLHALTEILNDHHQGRCVPMPVTKSCQELGLNCEDGPSPWDNVQNGEDWFLSLPVAQQILMMGQSKYNAWRDGAFEFEDLSLSYADPVWGVMVREATLTELIAG